jgi:hypothetical protein
VVQQVIILPLWEKGWRKKHVHNVKIPNHNNKKYLLSNTAKMQWEIREGHKTVPTISQDMYNFM